MTNDEFATYLDSLPPEVRAAIFEGLKPVGDYAAQAIEVRTWLAKEFPTLHPPIRAVLSLALARFR